MRLHRIVGVAALVGVWSVCAAWAQVAGGAPVSAEPTKVPAQTEGEFAKTIDSMLAGLASDDPKTRGDAKSKLEGMCHAAGRPGAEDERGALCKAIASKLGGSSPQPARVWMLRMIQNIGRGECVPALAPLLADKDAEVQETARRALQHNPSAEAGAALRAELDKATTSEWRIAITNSLGARKDAAAAAAIAKLLADKDAAVAMAAARALGNIGSAEAAKALGAARGSAEEKVRPTVVDAYLLCADGLVAAGKKDEAGAIYEELYAPAESPKVRVAALRGLVLAKPEKAIPILTDAITGKDEKLQTVAIRFAADLQGAEATKALTALIPKVAPPLQAALLGALGSRGDAAAKPAVLEAIKSAEEVVRAAAYKALGLLGDGSDVPMLAQAAAGQGADADAARAALARLPSRDADAAMLKLLEGGDAKVRTEVIRALADRKAVAAAPALLKATGDPDESIQAEAVTALGALGDEKVLPALVSLVVKTQSNKVRDAGEKAVAAISRAGETKEAYARMVLAALPDAQTPAKCALLRVLAGIGGTMALGAVRDGVKDAKPEVQEAAIRALSNWPDAAASPDLLAIANNSALKQNLRILVLGGYVRLVGSAPAADKLKMYQEAMALARQIDDKRPDERRMILSGVGELKGIEALKLVVPCLDEKGLQEEASAAAVNIAKDLPLTGQGSLGDEAVRETARAAMDKVLAVCKNKKVTTDASRALDRIKKVVPKPAK